MGRGPRRRDRHIPRERRQRSSIARQVAALERVVATNNERQQRQLTRIEESSRRFGRKDWFTLVLGAALGALSSLALDFIVRPVLGTGVPPTSCSAEAKCYCAPTCPGVRHPPLAPTPRATVAADDSDVLLLTRHNPQRQPSPL